MEKDILNNLNDELEDVIDEGREMLNADNLAERFDEFKTDAELKIRKNPIQSVLLGAFVGYVIAKIFK